MPAAEPSTGPRFGMGSLRFLHADPRRAIADEHIVCLMCGRALRQLTNTHLRLHRIWGGMLGDAIGLRATLLIAEAAIGVGATLFARSGALRER